MIDVDYNKNRWNFLMFGKVNKINFKLYKIFLNKSSITYKLWHLRSAIKELQNKFINTYNNKAANNYTIFCISNNKF